VDVDGFRQLLAPPGQTLLAGLPAYDESTALALGERLRRDADADLVANALTLSRLRTRARTKFGATADVMYFTPAGLEQATRAPVAERHARRFADAGVRRVADLGCGIGADSLALARAGVEVLAVDRDPLTAAVAEANARACGVAHLVEVRCADVTEVDLSGYDAAWCDPARRGSRGRTFDPDAWSPPWSVVEGLLDRLPAVGVKVAPGIPHDLVPPGVEAEWVSDGGDVKEAALWAGALSSGVPRRATLLPSGATVTGSGAAATEVGSPGRWLYEPDGAVVRAGLVAQVAEQVGGWLVDPTIAYVSADRLTPTPLASAYEITDVLPFSLKRLRALLREREVGSVVVKKRGSAIEPEALRKQLRLRGAHSAVVVLTRVAGAPTVLLARPAAP
jgi:SAM-dependent methyltransferase